MSSDHDAGIITVPGLSARHLTAAFEDLRVANNLCDVASPVQSAIDELDDKLSQLLNYSIDVSQSDSEPVETAFGSHFEKSDDSNNDEIHITVNPNHPNSTSSLVHHPSTSQETGAESPNFTTELPEMGDNIELLWPEDSQYYPGNVS